MTLYQTFSINRKILYHYQNTSPIIEHGVPNKHINKLTEMKLIYYYFYNTFITIVYHT